MSEATAVHPDGIEERADGDNIRVFLWADGVGYEVCGLEPEDQPVFRERIKQRRQKPIIAVVEELANVPAEYREIAKKELWDRAYEDINRKAEDRVPTLKEIGAWLDTPAGEDFSFYVMLKKKNPDMTEQKAKEIVERIGKAEFLKVRKAQMKRVADKLKERG